MSSPPGPAMKRREVYPRPIVDGEELRDSAVTRLRTRMGGFLVSGAHREEAELERLVRSQPGVTRANTVAVVSPKGGVGKTTSTFLIGELLASRARLRTIAVDANPDFGTLAALAPDGARSERSLADLIADADRLHTAAELRPYVSRLPSGLHLLGAPADAEAMAGMTPELYGELLSLLWLFYEVVILDLGTGITGDLAQFAIGRADQLVIVTNPEWVTSSAVLGAIGHLQHERATAVLNKARPSTDRGAIEGRFREQRLHRSLAIPYDEQLALMLDTGTYSLDALRRQTRTGIKTLGLAVAEQLV